MKMLVFKQGFHSSVLRPVQSFAGVCGGPQTWSLIRCGFCKFYPRLLDCKKFKSKRAVCSVFDSYIFNEIKTIPWLTTRGKLGVGPVPGSRHSFHTTPQRCIPPILWLLLKPVAKLGAILSGRTARKWWQTLTEARKGYFWEQLRKKWYLVALTGAGFGGAGIAYYKYHVEETPITGRKRFIAVTHEQFMKIANAEAVAQLQEHEDKILPANHPYYERVLRIGNRLAAANPEIKELMTFKEWKCYVIHDKSCINAFVLPTGHMFVFSGLLDFCSNDDQLAVVIAHEMAHAMLNHGIELASYGQLLDFVIIIAMAAIWCIMPTDGISFITQWFYDKFMIFTLHMPYSRELEREADRVGLQLTAKACYDVREGSVFWTHMGLAEDEGDRIPEWLSTHPSHGERSYFFEFMVPKAVEMREQAKCPQLPSRDPRETIKMLSKLVDDTLTAKKARQNLNRVPANELR